MTSGPTTLPESLVGLARTGWNMWVRLLGRKRARRLMIGGAVVSAIVAVVLEARL